MQAILCVLFVKVKYTYRPHKSYFISIWFIQIVHFVFNTLIQSIQYINFSQFVHFIKFMEFLHFMEFIQLMHLIQSIQHKFTIFHFIQFSQIIQFMKSITGTLSMQYAVVWKYICADAHQCKGTSVLMNTSVNIH